MNGQPKYEGIDFKKKLLIRSDSACSNCGVEIHNTREAIFDAGEITIYRMLQIATDESQCLSCKEPLAIAVNVCTRVPGGGPWVVATAPEQEISVCQEYPEKEVRAQMRLTDNEIDAARKLGSPISVRAAWSEAIFESLLSGEESMFPAGAGVKCWVGTEPRSGINLLSPEPGAGIPIWFPHNFLADLSAANLRCSIDADMKVLSQQVEKEASHVGLAIHSSTEDCVVVKQVEGFFESKVSISEVLLVSVQLGLSLAIVASGLLQRIDHNQRQLESALKVLTVRLGPKSVKTLATTLVEFTFDGGGQIHIDVGRYLDSEDDAREQMITDWATRASTEL